MYLVTPSTLSTPLPASHRLLLASMRLLLSLLGAVFATLLLRGNAFVYSVGTRPHPVLEVSGRPLLATQYTIDDDVCAPTDEAELRKVVQRHCRTLGRFLENRPIAAHTTAGFRSTKEMLEASDGPASSASRKFILDSGCGTGRSTLLLGELYPDHNVIGVDRSFVRLNRNNNIDNEIEDSDESRRPFQSGSANALLVRAELTDFWRCCLNEGWNIEQHHILYPNPYPKKNRLKKRFYAHPSFPLILTLGGEKIVVRSNWEGYLKEFSNSIVYASEFYDEEGMDSSANIAKPYLESALKGPRERIDKTLAWTNFENKYDVVGEKTYELVLERR